MGAGCQAVAQRRQALEVWLQGAEPAKVEDVFPSLHSTSPCPMPSGLPMHSSKVTGSLLCASGLERGWSYVHAMKMNIYRAAREWGGKVCPGESGKGAAQ